MGIVATASNVYNVMTRNSQLALAIQGQAVE
jgi:hypothetical protein